MEKNCDVTDAKTSCRLQKASKIHDVFEINTAKGTPETQGERCKCIYIGHLAESKAKKLSYIETLR